MKNIALAASLIAGALVAVAPALAENEGQGRAVVTVLPAHGNEGPASLSAQDLSIKVNGKSSTVTGLQQLNGSNGPIELVILMDSGSRSDMGTQFGEIAKFVKNLPADAKVTFASMQNGMARMAGPLTTDHEAALKGLRLPAGFPGGSASPYFCLSDLAKNWPSKNQEARREVLMITDGVDYYHPRYDPEDPYMQAAIRDSVRSGLVVYSIYWENRGRFDRSFYGNAAGQNLLLQVTQATGGNSYWQGMGNPVSFEPFLKDLQRRLDNQYEMSFTAPLKNKPEVQDMKLKVNGISGKVDAPGQVYVEHSM